MGGETIKKGSWKAEEDQVLIKHVTKYGPRDWSSIRSKGLLQRTGKSCRLRWVNKLQANLKNGVKFSADVERVVIVLQGEFGNKWARIATYLPGRQKRLARVLHTSPPNTQKSIPAFEAPKLGFSDDGESSVTSPKTLSCSSSYCEPIKMNPLNFDQNHPFCQLDYTTIPLEDNSSNEHPLHEDFPHAPPLESHDPTR